MIQQLLKKTINTGYSVTENKDVSSHDELFLFSSNSLMGEKWLLNANNPIISDVGKSRPAGSIFKIKDKLYRPSQNSAKRYGHGVVINEIIDLNEDSYKENTIQFIYPNWEKNIKAVHSLNNVSKLTVIDAIYKRRK